MKNLYADAISCYKQRMWKIYTTLLLLPTLAACGLDASASRFFDPDAEFAKLDQPDVDTVTSALENSAQDAMKNGEFQRSAQFYQQLLDKDANNGSYMVGLADAVRRAGDIAEAEELYQAALDKDPNNLNAQEGLGLSQMAMGNTVESGKTLAKVLERAPTRWRTLNGLGLLFTTKGLTDDSIEYFKEALVHKPRHPSILNNVGLAYAIDGNYTLAVKQLQTAARYTKPDSFQRRQVELNLALVYGLSGDMKQAEVLASKYLEGAALSNNLGLYAFLADDDTLAKSYLNGALSNSPQFYERAWENLNIVEESSNKDTSRGSGQPDPRKEKSVKIR